MTRDRQRAAWTDYVRNLEAKKNNKRAKKPRSKKPQPVPAELERALDELVDEHRDHTKGDAA